MKNGGKYSCPFCLVNLRDHAQTTWNWGIMRSFDQNWRLQPNEAAAEYLAKLSLFHFRKEKEKEKNNMKQLE